MMHTIRYIMVGGFLGAGKTTTLGRLAKSYQDRGLRVGIVTNDQATDLVDTNTLRSHGFHVNEVAGFEAAPLKTIGLWEGFFGVANLISSENAPELSLPSNCDVKEVDVIANARVACDPAELQTLVTEIVTEACQERGASVEFHQTQSFRPGRPQPTHRFALA